MTCRTCHQRPARAGRPYCYVCDPGPAPVDPRAAKVDKAGTLPDWHFDPAFRKGEGGLRERYLDDEYRPERKGRKK